jgi:hypothetical protein
MFLFVHNLFSQSDTYKKQKDKIELAERLDGLWLNKTYLDSIQISKSPGSYIGDKIHITWFGFRLIKDNLLTEKPYLGGFYIHEGGYGCNLLFEAKSSSFITTNLNLLISGEVAYNESGVKLSLINDTLLEFDFSTGKEYYIKNEKYNAANNEIDLLINRAVIEGEYKDIISGQYFHFYKNGFIAGFEKILKYEIAYDFVGIPIFGINVISFKEFKSETQDYQINTKYYNENSYKFEFKQDILYMYPIKSDWYNDKTVEVLPVKFKLKKITH